MAASRTREAKRLAIIMKARRKELGLTGADVARRTGLNPSTIMRLEQGIFARPNPHSLQAIANALDLPEQDLMTEAGWLPKHQPISRKPHVRIICRDIPADVVREIRAAVDAIAERGSNTFDTYHESVSSDDDRAA